MQRSTALPERFAERIIGKETALSKNLGLERRGVEGVVETKEGVISGPSYQVKGPEKQEKIEELLGIRDGYRRQRRIWYWLLAFSFLSAYILMNRGGSRTMLYGMICLAVGLYPLWNIIKCNRVIKKIDRGLDPFRVAGKKSGE